jgi:cytoskeletal protein CcmA (bactofilin family)
MVKNTIRVLSILSLLVVLFALSAAPVFAFDGRSGDKVTISSGETVNGDVYMAGNEITIDGTVNGDVYAVGSRVTIKGTINGAITLAGQYVSVSGKIERSARLAGSEVTFTGNIKGDVILLGSDITVGRDARIGNDLVIAGTKCNILGNVDGRVSGGASTCTIDGKIGKDVDIDVGALTVDSSAQILGDLTYSSENQATVKSTAKISGKQTQKQPIEKDNENKGFMAEVPGKIAGLLMAFITALILVFIAPRRLNSAMEAVQNKLWICLGWGAVFLFAGPIAILIVCCTVIGLPVALIALALWLIFLYLSQIPVALLIGKLIISRNQPMESKGKMLGALAIGLTILMILTWLPYIGFFTGLAVTLLGMGSFFVSEMNLRKGV